jgi:hypothetical protein
VIEKFQLLFLKRFLALNVDPNLNFFQECVWIEITVTDGRDLLIGNHYFAPDIKVDIIKSYFNFLENILDALNQGSPNFSKRGPI